MLNDKKAKKEGQWVANTTIFKCQKFQYQVILENGDMDHVPSRHQCPSLVEKKDCVGDWGGDYHKNGLFYKDQRARTCKKAGDRRKKSMTLKTKLI